MSQARRALQGAGPRLLADLLPAGRCGRDVGRYCSMPQDHGLDEVARHDDAARRCASRRSSAASRWRRRCRSATSTASSARSSAARSRAGTAPTGLPDDTIQLHFNGSAGQSFGAFVPQGITLTLEGDANDYVGKGLSGGKIIVYPPARLDASCPRRTSSSATSRSTARPAARRTSAAWRASASASATAASTRSCEAVGDHGCEYMTGGRVVVLGPTGQELRGRHVGRHRLRARRGRRLRRAAATRRWCSSTRWRTRRRSTIVKRAGLPARASYTGSDRAGKVLRRLGRHRAAVRQGVPERLPPRARDADARCARPGLSATRRRIMAAFEAERRTTSRGWEASSRRHGQADWIHGVPRRELPLADRSPLERIQRLGASSTSDSTADDEPAATAGRALHGLRRAVLPHRRR